MDFVARSDVSENNANNSSTNNERALDAAATPQLDCTSSHNMEDVQVFGGKSLVDVSTKREYSLQIETWKKIFFGAVERILIFRLRFPLTNDVVGFSVFL